MHVEVSEKMKIDVIQSRINGIFIEYMIYYDVAAIKIKLVNEVLPSN